MPKITKCNNSHFYDAERFSSCPYCSKGTGADATGDTIPNGMTVPVTPPSNNPTVPVNPPIHNSGATVSWDNVQDKTVPVSNPNSNVGSNSTNTVFAADEQKTVAKYTLSTNGGKEPVVGWLVAIEGKHRGEDFRLKAGKNFIGRDRTMDVVLENDKSVSRVKHAIFTYDPKGNMFIAHSGETHELTYFNGEVLLDSKVVRAYDKLSVGETTLMFIPLVSDNFSWDE